MALLQVCDVTYEYKSKSGNTQALRGVCASFQAGVLYAVTGRSGSGKTTLLSLLAAFDVPKTGRILYDGTELPMQKPEEYRRQHVGMIFQSYNLIPHLTVLENVMLSMEIGRSEKSERRKKAIDALYAVGLTESQLQKKPLQLSGGEQQRVAIARTLAAEPEIILADEPTGNLDNENSEIVIGLLQDLAHQKNRCVILVTHAEEIAAKADVRMHMTDGKIS